MRARHHKGGRPLGEGVSQMDARLKPATVALLRWATEAALPLWATVGFDTDHQRFEERLTFRAERLSDVPVRLMSQARQIYVYALAARRGWYAGAAELVSQAYLSMVRDYRGRNGRDGWIFSIRRDGAVADSRRDLYAHAFVLLAIASYIEATGARDALSVADETLAFIDRHLAAPEAGGFLDGLPPLDGIRRQNPHMHMFEALLSLWECSGEARYLARAGEIFGLFASRFFRSDLGVLGECFTAGLEPAEGNAGRLLEPGHHYEWVWLLRRFERASGRSVQSFADALYRHADTYGFDRDGLIVDELLLDGSHQTRSRRAWPITEAIKANVAEAARFREGAEGKASILAEVLLRRFLVSNPAGGWIDRLDEKGDPATNFMPASTFYHVACAIDELNRFTQRKAR
jgi:mannose/cellobiose epimerase-like protein (N-acyl-D-glucosamine 2-epimerase family)